MVKKMVTRHTFIRDCEALARCVERSRGWCGPGVRDRMAYEFRHPTAETFIRNVCCVLGDRTLPGAQEPAGRLFELIMTLTDGQLAALLAAA